MPSELDRCLARFAERWHLGELSKDAEDRYCLEVDGRLRVWLFQVGPYILIEGSPGRLPDDERQSHEQLISRLREYLGELGAIEEVLTLAPEGLDLILFRRLSAATLSLEGLEEALEAFINRLDDWTRRLSGSPSSPPLSMPYLIFP